MAMDQGAVVGCLGCQCWGTNMMRSLGLIGIGIVVHASLKETVQGDCDVREATRPHNADEGAGVESEDEVAKRQRTQ